MARVLFSKSSLEVRVRNLDLSQLWAGTRDNFIDKHLGLYDGAVVTDSDLIHRVVTSKKDASCFTVSRDEVLLYVKEAMYDDLDGIVAWVNDMSDGDDYEVYFDSDTPVGRGFYKSFYHTWNAGACQCSSVRIVLRKTYKSDEFRIVTVYPIPTEEEKEACILASKEYDAIKSSAKRYA